MMKRLRREGLLRGLKRQTATLRHALDDPRTPRNAKLLGAAVLAYLVSPVDLIPDFIPVLGQLDDLILVPAGFYVVWRMIPKEVWRDAQARTEREG